MRFIAINIDPAFRPANGKMIEVVVDPKRKDTYHVRVIPGQTTDEQLQQAFNDISNGLYLRE